MDDILVTGFDIIDKNYFCVIYRLGGPEGLQLNPSTLNDYELVIASHLVVPDDIAVSWSDIAGLDSVIEELRESVVLPIRHRHLFANSQLWEAPKGKNIEHISI